MNGILTGFDHIIGITKKVMNKDCKTCKYNKLNSEGIYDCVNIGAFKENNCLQYEMTIEAMNEAIEKLND